MKEQVKQAIKPHLTILLVIRNEEAYISRLLDKLLNQKKQGFTMELIVVDGQSTDKTASIVKMYSEKYTEVRLLENQGKTLPIGWNLGIKHAIGDYILRIDGHTTIPDNFLEQYATIIKENPEADVVGGIIHSRGEGKQGKVNEYVYSHPFGVGNSKFRTLEGKHWKGYVDTVPYGAYKREVFDEVGLFDETLKRNEDIEFHKRMRDAGKTFFLSTSIASTYFVRPTLKGLIDKSLGDGMWNIIANRITPGALGTRHKAPLFAFVMGLIMLIFALFSNYAAICLFVAVGLYTFLNAIASFGYVKKEGIRYWPLCMLTFFILHFFRGFGSFKAFFTAVYWKKAR